MSGIMPLLSAAWDGLCRAQAGGDASDTALRAGLMLPTTSQRTAAVLCPQKIQLKVNKKQERCHE